MDQLKYKETSTAFLEKDIKSDIGKAIDSADQNLSIADRENELDKISREHNEATTLLL